MTRFLIGFVAGAFGLALIQYLYAPIPTMEDSGTATSEQTQLSADERSGAIQGDEQGKQGGLSDDVVNRQRTGRIELPASSADADGSTEADTEKSEGIESGPVNPIALPDTHAGFVDKNAPSLPDEHSKVEEEEVDSGWAENVEAQIYSFVSSHPDGELIQIVSLACRTTRCEIVGTVFGEQGGKVWNGVLKDMQKQPWFASNFAPSMFGSGGGFPGEFRFITIVARVGSEIAPPVRQ